MALQQHRDRPEFSLRVGVKEFTKYENNLLLPFFKSTFNQSLEKITLIDIYFFGDIYIF